MPVPKTFDALKAAGYRFENDASCTTCGEEIEWWTTPRGHSLPLQPMPTTGSPVRVHFASTCDNA